MNRDEPISRQHASDDRIDEVCDTFEEALRNGQRPRIADFIDRCAVEDRGALFYELVMVELEFRHQAGETPSRQEYVDAFPEFAEQITAIDFTDGRSAAPPTVGMGETAKPSELRPGALIAHFLLNEPLGVGGMGEVWKAWDCHLKRTVAIKLPRAGQLSEADLHRFLREGRAAAQLRHPQLAAVHDSGRYGERVYIVADYVEGVDLRQHLAKGRLSFRDAAALCADLAEALHHAHERGVVHRDLKPANVIMDPAGRPHVIDFGLAKWSSDDQGLTQKGELLGTPAYMAPEQARGDTEDVGPHTDVYGVGAILYELITGRSPFSGGPAAVVHAILEKVPTPPRGVDRSIPRDLETICLRALEKDPKKRYRTAQEMAVDLRRFAAGDPILARRVGPLEKGWRWLRRRPAVAAAILLLIVAVGAIAFAGSLAKKNRDLLGFHTVSLTTEPEGARVAFARLTDSGELIPDQVTIPSDVTPLRLELLPGDYFVEAVLPDGRFHQVFRRVSKSAETLSFTNPQTRLRIADDGTIILARITIPEMNITRGMVLIPAMEQGDEDTREDFSTAPSFFIEPREFTYRQWRELPTKLYLADLVDAEGTDDEKVSTTFETALRIAEISGKRLPTKFEYERLHGFRANADSISQESSGLTSADDGTPSSTKKKPTAANGKGTSDFLRYTPSVSLGLGFRCVRSARPMFVDVND